MYKFENPVSIRLLDGETSEVIYQHDTENAISDDILCAYGAVFISNQGSGSGPACFLLPDGSNWSGFTYDRMNPWAPYCITANNTFDNTAQNQWQYKTTYTAPSNPVTGQHKLFFLWNDLPTNLQLKAIGLTGWQSNASGGNIAASFFGASSGQPAVFVPQTLVVLPTSILIHGRNEGATTPDVLEVSYFLSVVGAS